MPGGAECQAEATHHPPPNRLAGETDSTTDEEPCRPRRWGVNGDRRVPHTRRSLNSAQQRSLRSLLTLELLWGTRTSVDATDHAAMYLPGGCHTPAGRSTQRSSGLSGRHTHSNCNGKDATDRLARIIDGPSWDSRSLHVAEFARTQFLMVSWAEFLRTQLRRHESSGLKRGRRQDADRKAVAMSSGVVFGGRACSHLCLHNRSTPDDRDDPRVCHDRHRLQTPCHREDRYSRYNRNFVSRPLAGQQLRQV